jgi:hypothetical protein
MAQNDNIYGTSAFDGTVKSDFLALGIVPDNLRSQFIDYSTADFSEFKEALLSYLKAVYPLDYTNFVESDLGIVLVELFSYLASVISLKSDLLANELYLPTVQTVGNLSKLLNLVGISLKGPIASKATVRATVPTSRSVGTGETMTIPLASRTFSVPNTKDGGALFFTLYETNLTTGVIDLNNKDIILQDSDTINAGTQFNNLVLLEGELRSQAGTFSNLNTIQSINLTSPSIVEKSIVVSANTGDIYTEVENLFLADDGKDAVFQKIYNDDYSCTLVFGDNTRGKSPAGGVQYRVFYRIGGGSRGNVPAVTINQSINAAHSSKGATSITIQNSTHSAGGANAETVEHAKKWAPYFFKTQYRAVTGEDYTAYANQFVSTVGQTAKAQAVLRRSGAGANMIDIYVISKATELQVQRASLPFKQELLAYLNKYKMITDEVTIVDGLVRTVDLVITIFADREFEPFEESVKRSAADKVINFFSVDSRSFGERVKLSDLQRDIFEVQEIRFSTIDNYSEDIKLDFNEIVQLNNVEINIEYV